MFPALVIDNLSVHFPHADGAVAAVREASLTVRAAECIGVVGESGSGKTQLFLAVMGLLAAGVRADGSVRFQGDELLGLPRNALNRVRGSRLTMVFQDPMTSLTPHLRIGVQLAEVLVSHSQSSWREAERATLRMLERVRVPDAPRRLRQYPHELSGGLRQRVMIGMSLLCEPSLLIADEPTTALDVTVQEQLIDLLRTLRNQSRMAIALISHDMGVVAGLADRIAVMYAGRVVESGLAQDVLQRTLHPYTAELLKCVPDLKAPRLERMPTLTGQAPSPSRVEIGCAFAPRCALAVERCRSERPMLQNFSAHARGKPAGGGAVHQVACHFPLSR